jgi:phosphoribosylglycinamide formyltransferase 1
LKRLGILLSGRGSNFEAIADNVQCGRLAAEIAVVISNRPEARGLETARSRGLTSVVLPAVAPASQGASRAEYDGRLVAELQRHRVDLVCLAGFMRLLSAEFCRAFPLRVLNIHPSLLPAFPGLHAQRQALEHGVKISGCTVHFVDEQLDAGPIVLQAAVPVLDDDTEDTLAARILTEEHRIYSQAIALILSERWRIEGRRVIELPVQPSR